MTGYIKRAAFVVTSIAVLCPHCGAEQPSPDNGSDMWTPDQIRDEKRECVSCDEPFVIVRPSRVPLPLVSDAPTGDKP